MGTTESANGGACARATEDLWLVAGAGTGCEAKHTFRGPQFETVVKWSVPTRTCRWRWLSRCYSQVERVGARPVEGVNGRQQYAHSNASGLLAG